MKYEALTNLIEPLKREADELKRNPPDDSRNLGDAAAAFNDAIHEFDQQHPEAGFHEYHQVLGEYGLEWSSRSFEAARVERMDARGVLALLLALARANRWDETVLNEYLTNGKLIAWLERLAELDSE